MTVATRRLFLLTTNPVTPSLSLILSGAGSLQVTVMEVVVRLATARPCGGPVGTGKADEGMRYEGVQTGHFLFSKSKGQR